MMTNLKSINYQLSFDIIFPHSKIVEVININADDTRKRVLEGHSGAALDTVSHMFEVGFNTYVSQIINKCQNLKGLIIP
jgi:hypothetical protein